MANWKADRLRGIADYLKMIGDPTSDVVFLLQCANDYELMERTYQQVLIRKVIAEGRAIPINRGK